VEVPAGGRVAVELAVNGARHEVEVEPRWLLSDVLRHQLGLTGTHVGCEHGVCGCCTVLVDGRPARACLTLAVSVEGADIRTVEGLAGPDGRLHPLQEAFRRHHGLQCGFCTPGFLMAALPFWREAAAMDDQQLREAIAGQLCRCTGYAGILAALRAARGIADEEEEAAGEGAAAGAAAPVGEAGG
jgi:aerobic-type carbon monoxide dehydrogenase small subunit (CoxS/CutS family)